MGSHIAETAQEDLCTSTIQKIHILGGEPKNKRLQKTVFSVTIILISECALSRTSH